MKKSLPQKKQTLFLFLLMLMCMQLGSAQTIIPEFTNLQTNGSINAIQIDEANGNVYVGGSFSRIGNRTSYGGAVDDVNGDQSYFHALPDGDINVVKSDGSGGYFIAGDFTMIGTTTRNGLAHINAAGALSAWDPNPNNEVLDIVVSGSTVYVGGGFTTIGGQSRARIAALDATTGLATSWNPGSNGDVQQLAVAGGFAYAYSPFANFMGGESIDRLAKISTSTGAADASWNPAPVGTVSDMIVDGSNLYIGGFFTTVGGVTRNRLAAIAISTGNLTSWNPNVSSGTVVNALAIHGSNLYAGGIFTTVGAQTVKNLAEIDLTTGTASSFTLASGSSITSLNVSGNSLYIGNFSFTIGGVTRDGMGEVDLTTDLLTSWDPGLVRAPNAVAISGSSIYMGGASSFILGGERRNNLAAFELADGTLTSWNPDSDGTINDLAITSTSIYVAGSFDNVGGQVRDNLAEILKSNGLATSFDPDVSSTVDDLLLSGDQLFVGGSFTSVGGGSRNRLAVYDITDGSLSAWNPNLNSQVFSLATDGSTLYVGGNFTTASGTSRSRIAAYDIVSESLTTWNPGASDRVESLATGNDGTVYAGGRFSTIGGVSRTRFASIDPSTGVVNALNIALSWVPYTIVPSPQGTVYVGGGFTTVNGVSQAGAFAFNSTTEVALDWDIETQADVFAVALTDFSVYFAGTFSSVLGESTGDFAGVSRANGAPVSFTLPDNAIPENAAVGTSVGSFTVSDDAGDTHTYSLVAGAGDDDNAAFTIDGASLESNLEFDFETKTTYNIRASVTDDKGNSVEDAFVINVSDVIETGTDITSISVPEQISPAEIDPATHYVNIDIGFGNDKSSLAPVFEVSSGATVTPASGVARDFTLAKVYTVTAENGFTDQDWTVVMRGYYPAQTFTVGPTGDFANLVAAFSNLTSVGISGDIVLELEDGFTDPGGVLTGGWAGQADNTVTIRPESGATSAGISRTSTCTICIIDIENVIFDGMGIMEVENTNAFGVPVDFQTAINSENVVFRNLLISSRSGDAFNVKDVDGLLIENNSYSYGASFQSQDARVFNIATTASDVQIIGNEITLDDQFDGAFTMTFVFSLIDDTYVYNNVVHAFPTSTNAFTAFRDRGRFVHNTIVLDGSGTIGSSNLVRLSQLAIDAQITNNIVVADVNNDAGVISSFLTSGSLQPSWNFSNNNFYVRDADANDYPDIKIVGNFGSYDLAAILAIAPGTSFTQPIFTDQANGDLTLSGASLSDADLRGTPNSAVLTDIEGTNRSVFASSKGAYESPNNIKEISSFTFSGIDGAATIDEGTFTVDALALDGTDLTSISPTIGIIAGSSISPTSNTAQNFTSTVTYTVTAEDASTQGWTVTISPPNSEPTDIALDNTAVAENQASGSTVGSLTSTDVDAGETYTYTLVSGTGDTDNGSFAIVGDQLESAEMFDFETKSTYAIRINTNDGNGGNFEKQFSITISDASDTPTDIVLDNTSVAENQAAGAAVGLLTSTDQDVGETYTYTLVAGTGDTDNASFALTGNELQTAEAFDFETKASYSIRINTNDGNGGDFEKQFTITVDDAFEAPTDLTLSASAINENNVINATTGTLSTTDEDAGETYTYSLISGSGDTDNASFNISGNLLRASATFNFESKASYSIRLQTNDGNGGLYAEEFTVTVNDQSETPTDIALSASSITENNAVNATVGNLTTTDEDAGETYTYTLVSGSGDADNASFNISGNALRASSAFDFEGQSTYSVRVQTDDGNGGTIQEAFSISVTNQSESPTDLALSSADIDESSPVGSTVGTLSTVDEDNVETYTYTLVSGTGSTDNASFSISGNELQSAEIFDFETKTSYTVRVETNDGNGGLLEEAFTISINNLPPGLTGVGITSTSIDENLSSGSSVGDLFALGDEINGVSFTFTLVAGTGDSDNGSFSISANTLQNTAPFDFESNNQYSIRVMADDGAGSTIDQIILIDVNDVNEAPTDAQLSASSLNENNATNETVGSFSSTDEDTGDTHSYSLVSGSGDEDNSSFAIAGSVLQASESFDFEAQSSYSVRVQASDGNGGTYVEVFSISITDQNDEPTALTLDVATIDENNSVGATVGAFSTTDQDSGDSFSYTLVSGSGDDDNGSFSFSGNQLQAGIGFDFETKNSYSIRVQTNDGNGGLLEQAFTITINDVNENPTDIALSNTSVEESNPVGTTIGSLSSIDEDAAQSHTYSLVSGAGDADNASFNISGSDILTAEVFDFETKTSYSIRVRTEDGNGGTYEESFTISIDDLPASITSFTLSNASVNENEASGSLIGSFSTSGEDLSGSFTYTFASGLGDTDNAAFAISANQLQTASVFDFETKSSYSVLVMTDDGTGNTREEIFTISVNDASEAPTALALNANSLTENNEINDVIGSLSTTDEDAGETFSYSLVTGTGDTDNASFIISGDELQAGEVFDFESQSSYALRLQTDDGNGGTFQQAFTITIVNENEAPTVPNVLSDVTVTEGFVSSQRSLATAFVDPDGDALTLTAASSDESIATPELQGTTLVITGSGLGTVVITVTADDGNTGTVSTSFNFTIEAAAQAPPTAIALSSTSIDENELANTEVAQISSTDINPADDAVYTFVAGEGDDDNTSFSISGTQLLSNEVFDFDTKSSYSIRLQVDDLNGGTFQQAFTISINDLGDNEVPTVAVALTDRTEVVGFGTAEIDLSGTFSDLDGDALALSAASSDLSVSTVSITGNVLTLTEVGIGTSTITVAADDGNGGSVIDSFTFTVNEESNSAPIVANPLADLTEEEGFEDVVVDLNGVFTDVDNDALTITVTSSDETVVIATLDAGNLVNVKERGVGTTTITVTADDGNGGSVVDEFTFTVSEPLNSAPIVANSLADLIEEEGFEDVVVDLNGVFTDADNDALTITVTSSDETVVIATLDAGNLVNVKERGVGTTTITVSANDGNGGMVSDSFTFTVNEVLEVATDIIAFSLTEQTGPATVDVDNHTVAIEIAYGTDATSLTPTIEVSNGASITPPGAQDFTNSVTYTVTAEDGATMQDWTVTVTEALSNETDILEFSDPDQKEAATIDVVNHTISIVIQPSTDAISFRPTLVVSEGATYTATEFGDLIQPITYTVTAADGVTIQDWIVTVTVDLSGTNGLGDEIDVTIYPNPVADFLKIKSNDELVVRLTTADGKELAKANGTDLTIDLRSFGSGIYILTLSDGNSVTNKRIIKAN